MAGPDLLRWGKRGNRARIGSRGNPREAGRRGRTAADRGELRPPDPQAATLPVPFRRDSGDARALRPRRVNDERHPPGRGGGRSPAGKPDAPRMGGGSRPERPRSRGDDAPGRRGGRWGLLPRVRHHGSPGRRRLQRLRADAGLGREPESTRLILEESIPRRWMIASLTAHQLADGRDSRPTRFAGLRFGKTFAHLVRDSGVSGGCHERRGRRWIRRRGRRWIRRW